jgi:hypothetical protein
MNVVRALSAGRHLLAENFSQVLGFLALLMISIVAKDR